MDVLIFVLVLVVLLMSGIVAATYFANQREETGDIIEEVGNSLNENRTNIDISIRGANGSRARIRRTQPQGAAIDLADFT